MKLQILFAGIEKIVAKPFISGFMLFLLLNPKPFPYGNQDPYFFWAFNEALEQSIQNDLLSSLPDPFPAFSLIFKAFPLHYFNAVCQLLFLASCVCYVYACFSFASHLFAIERPSLRFIFLFMSAHATLIWGYILPKISNVTAPFLMHHGIASQGLLFDYLQPSVAGIFLLVSLSRVLRKKISAAIWWMLPAGIFHFNYLLLSLVLFALIMFIYRPDRKSIVMPLVCLLLGYGWHVWYVFQHFYTPSTTEFINAAQYFLYQNPHHDYHSWFTLENFIPIIIIATGLFTINDRLLGGLYKSMLLFVVFSSVFVFLSKNIFLINMAPWRLSVLMTPLALIFGIVFLEKKLPQIVTASHGFILLLTFIAFFALGMGNATSTFSVSWIFPLAIILSLAALMLPSQISTNLLPFVILSFIIGLSSIRTFLDATRSEAAIDRELFTFIQQKTPQTSSFLIPESLQCFTLQTGRSAFYGNNLYFCSALPTFYERIKFRDAFYKQPENYSQTMLNSMGITHIILPISGKKPLEPFTIAYSNKDYVILNVE